MQIGDVALYAPDPNSEIDRLIIKAQSAAGFRGQFIHCEIAIGERYLVGAVEPVVRVGPLGLLAPAAIVTPPWPDAAAAERAADYAVSQIGVRYDTFGVALFGLSLIAPAWKTVLLHGTEAFERHAKFCSALVANALLVGGLTPPDVASASSPAALAAWLQVR